MAKIPGLILRGGKYYYRQRVPLDLVETYGRSEIKCSLRTSDRNEAKAARNRKAVEIDLMFERMRDELAGTCNIDSRRLASLSKSEIETRIKRHVQAETTNIHIELGSFDSEVERKERGNEAAALLQVYRDKSSPQFLIDKELLKQNLFGKVLDKQHLTSRERQRVENMLDRALIETQRQELSALQQRFRNQPFDPEFDALDHQIASIADIADQYLEEYRQTHRSISPKRLKKIEAAIEYIKDYFGSEADIRSITRSQCREFRDRLNQMPANMRKHYPDPRMTLGEIIVAAKRDGKPLMKYETQESYIRPLCNLMEWAKAEQHIQLNPADGLHSLAERSPAKDSRDPFTVSELTKIFNAPLFRGCQNDAEGYAKAGPSTPKGTRFWIIAIGLYSGMRLNEICQLDVSDVQKTAKGTLFFNINNDGGKRVKNSPSKRKVPVHPMLLKMGFEKFLRRRQVSGDKKLFPSIKLSRDGYSSERISRWFNEGFLRSIGIKTKKLTFHSFRHTFKDAMRAAGISLSIQDAVGGWNTIKGVSENYGKGYEVDQLFEEVSKVSYDGLDLNHLVDE